MIMENTPPTSRNREETKSGIDTSAKADGRERKAKGIQTERQYDFT